MKSVLCALVMLIGLSAAQAQQQIYRGDVHYPYLGIRLTVPPGWKGVVDDDVLLLGSDTDPGLIALMVNEATDVSQLKSVADQGIAEDGVFLRRSGPFERVGAEGLAAPFTGSYQGTPAGAFLAGIINPFGNSVSVIAITSKDKYSSRQPRLVKAIANSLKFAKPKESPFNARWQQALAGKKLTYMKSSYSSGPSYTDSSGNVYGSYSSYSSRSVIHLCSNQAFSRSSSSNSSFDAAGGFGSAHGGGNNQGRWKLVTSAGGNSVLQLNGAGGKVFEYELDYREGKTYLNGTRYFRTPSEACR